MIRNIKILILLLAALAIGFDSYAAQLGKVLSFSENKGTVIITSEKGKILITPYSSQIVKVLAIENNAKSSELPSKSIVLKADGKFVVNESTRNITLALPSGLNVVVDKDNSGVDFMKNHRILLQEDNACGKIAFRSSPTEAFYGAGERGIGYNLRGDSLIMYNKQNYGYGKGDRTAQMNITVPFYISSHGYGVFFDDYSPATLVLKNPVEYITENSNPVAYYFINSSDGSIANVLKEYTSLTGRQDLAPFWSLGYITSKYGYKTQAETEGTIDTLRREGYPVDAIVLDLYWYGKETDMGRFEWNKDQWSDHRKMLAELKSKGVKTIIISQPYLNKIGAIDNYNMAASKGMLAKDSLGNVHDVTTWVGDAGMLDVSNPTTRDWLWGRYSALTREGVSGWWGDLGEPEVHPLTILHANGMTASEYHNVYGNDWSQIIYDGFKKEFPNVRLMTLMRGGTAGLQRFSVFPWSTDVSRSWGGLQAQIPIMLNSALSGLGYMSHDVGGFAVDKNNPVDPQLYARWLELGLFTPILRTHSTMDAEPYHYAEYQELFKGIINDRYRWLPYNYTLAYENATEGAPFVRPLNFYNASDTATVDIQDEYLWGRDILVAPILDKDATSRMIYFPKGKWYSFNNPQQYFDGPIRVRYDAPIDVLPLFARAGAIIPLADYAMKSTEDYNPANYTILYFPADTTSRYSLFDDDRTSTGTIKGDKYQLIDFTARHNDEYTTIAIESEGMGYRNMPAARILTFEIMDTQSAPKSIKMGLSSLKPSQSLAALKDGEFYYDSISKKLIIRYLWNYSPETLIIEH